MNIINHNSIVKISKTKIKPAESIQSRKSYKKNLQSKDINKKAKITQQ